MQVIRYDDRQYFVLLQPSGKWHLVDEPYDVRLKQDYEDFVASNLLALPADRRSGSLSVIVFLTERCNLRCDYCKVAKMVDAPNKKSTSAKNIALSLEESLSWTDGIVNVVFYGGEPLLKHREMAEICAHLSELNPTRFAFSVTTNGTLWDESICDSLRQHEITVGVSMDGPSKIHDLHRRYINLNPSHDLVSRNYAAMKRSGLNCGPICVVTDPSRMVETFDHFVRTYGDTSIYLKPLEVTGAETSSQLSIYFEGLLEGQFSLLRRNMHNYAQGLPRLVETHTLIKLENILLSHQPGIKTCKNGLDSRCSIGRTVRGIESDGDVLPCPTLKKYDAWDDETVEVIASKNGYCDGCAYSAVCTSFCLGEMEPSSVRRFIDGDTANIDLVCRYNKAFIDGVFELVRSEKKLLLSYVFQ